MSNLTHRHAVGLGLVAAALALLVSRNPRTPPEEVAPRSHTTEQAGVARPGPSASSVPIAPAAPGGPGVAQAPLARITPDREKLRSEVQADPNSPPPSLVQFSTELGRRTDLAIQDPARAGSTMSEVETCLKDANAAPQAQALCLKSADRLAEKYPELRDRRDSAAGSASLEGRRIYSALANLTRR